MTSGPRSTQQIRLCLPRFSGSITSRARLRSDSPAGALATSIIRRFSDNRDGSRPPRHMGYRKCLEGIYASPCQAAEKRLVCTSDHAAKSRSGDCLHDDQSIS